MKTRLVSLLLVVVLIATALVSTLPRPLQAQDESILIRLLAAEFDPGQGQPPNIPAAFSLSEKDLAQQLTSNQPAYYLVQFNGPVEQAWKDEVTKLGAELLDYIPDYTFKVRMTTPVVRQINTLKFVRWVGSFQPAYKLSADLLQTASRTSLVEKIKIYRVYVERGASVDNTAITIKNLGFEVAGIDGNRLLVVATSDRLPVLAGVLDVAWIDNFKLPQLNSQPSSRALPNEYGAGNLMGATTANARGYDGSTQTVAVADTGLGGGTTTTAHRDIPSGRITSIYNWPGSSSAGCYTITNDGAVDVDSGHGTHVTGSVLGGGGTSGEGKGTAPAAHLIFQAVENWVAFTGSCASSYTNGYYLMGLPTDEGTLFQQAYDAGARIHSNSWGSDSAGAYDADSVYVDTWTWNHKDASVFFAAGNAGTDANSDGVIDNGSVGSPSTAKNSITIGASENDRQGHYECDTSLTYATCTGQNSTSTWGGSWPTDYPTNPIKDDPQAGNAQQMAAFSSRGPAADGRIKPDIVAPGSWILSTYSDMYQQGYDSSTNPRNSAWQYDGYGLPRNQYYKYLSGTSMATPLSAGGGAVVRDYYKKAQSLDASAALIKATLINSAVDLLDENNDGVNDNDYPIPNNHEGWGLINLANATDGTYQYVDQISGLSTGGSTSYQYSVNSTATPLKVTLAWTDYPGSASASTTLVNNLNLVVTSPSGTVYRGNVFSAGWSATGGSADTKNNVENVYIQTPAVGTWTVTVSGANVPSGPQPYALVVDGSFGTSVTSTFTPTPTKTSTPTNTPTRTNTPTPSVTPTASNTPTPSMTPTASNTPTPTYTATPFSNELQNGVAVTNLSGSQNSQTNFTMNVPAGATNLAFTISGGTGDADLYVRFGVAPTTSTYDCRPYTSGNSETCSFATPQVGTYYVMLVGYNAYSGVSLAGTYSVTGPTNTPTPTATPTNTPTPTITPTPGTCPNASGGYCRTDTEARTWIAGTTNQSITSDDTTKSVTLPFSFTFAGTAYSSIKISSNGNAHFGTASSAYSNVAIPNTANPNALLAAFWDDLSPNLGGAIYTGVSGIAPNRTFVIEWRNVNHYGVSGTNGATFEIQLDEGTNHVWFLYQDTNFGSTSYNTGVSATSGIENAAGSAGSQYSYNSAVLTNGKVLHFWPQ